MLRRVGSQWTEARREEIWSVLGTNSQDKASSVVLKLFVLCSRDTDDSRQERVMQKLIRERTKAEVSKLEFYAQSTSVVISGEQRQKQESVWHLRAEDDGWS